MDISNMDELDKAAWLASRLYGRTFRDRYPWPQNILKNLDNGVHIIKSEWAKDISENWMPDIETALRHGAIFTPDERCVYVELKLAGY